MTMQTGLVPQHEGGSNRVVRRTEGMDVSRDALLPPIIKLIQPTTKDAERHGVGRFLRTDTEEVFDVLEAVPLVSKVTQTKWAGSFSLDALPECWSSNGITADLGARREGQECHRCQFFSPKPQRGKDRAMCATGHDVIFQDASSYTAFGMRLRGTGNRIVGLITAPSIAQRAVVKLYSEKTTGETGVWYQLKAKTVRLLDEADRDLAIATMRGYMDTNLGAQAEAEEEAMGQEGGPSNQEGLPLVASSALSKLPFSGVTPEMEGLPF